MKFHDSISVKELADELGMSAEATHYHVKAMLAVGLVRVAGRRVSGRRYERLFDRSAETYRFDSESADPEYRRLLRKTVTRLVQESESEYLECSQAADRDPSLLGRTFVRRFNAKLTPDTMTELRIRLAEVLEWARSQECADGVRVAGLVTFSQKLAKTVGPSSRNGPPG